MTVPSKIKQLKGTEKPSRKLDNEMNTKVLSTVGEIDRTAFVNEEAFNEWSRIYEILNDIQILQVSDITALMMLCNNVGIYQSCVKSINKKMMDKVNKSDEDEEDKKGDDEDNLNRREINMMFKAQEAYYKGCAKFGLTPADRMKIEMPNKKKDDPLAGL